MTVQCHGETATGALGSQPRAVRVRARGRRSSSPAVRRALAPGVMPSGPAPLPGARVHLAVSAPPEVAGHTERHRARCRVAGRLCDDALCFEVASVPRATFMLGAGISASREAGRQAVDGGGRGAAAGGCEDPVLWWRLTSVGSCLRPVRAEKRIQSCSGPRQSCADATFTRKSLGFEDLAFSC